MVSFDVKSLFTNIPINETINIACDTLFDPDRQFDTILTKNDFKQLLELATKGIIFLFNNKLYSEEDGVAVGSPLAPTFANLFLCHHEKLWLDNCPSEFKPRCFTGDMLTTLFYYSLGLTMYNCF